MINFITQSSDTVGQEPSDFGHHLAAAGATARMLPELVRPTLSKDANVTGRRPALTPWQPRQSRQDIGPATADCKRKCAGDQRAVCRIVWLVTADWESQWIELAGGDRS
jgi:hypothetical protein